MGFDQRSESTNAFERVPGAGADLVVGQGDIGDTIRIWVAGDDYPRVVIDPLAEPAEILVGDGTAAPISIAAGGGAGAPTNLSYITAKPEAQLSAEVPLAGVLLRDDVDQLPAPETTPVGARFIAVDEGVEYYNDGDSWEPIEYDAGQIVGLSDAIAADRPLLVAGPWFYRGEPETGALSVPWVAYEAFEIVAVAVTLGTAASNGDTIVDVNKNGTTIFTDQGNRPTIGASDTVDISSTPDVTALAQGDVLTVDIDAVGDDAADLTVQVIIRRA